ncbi:MAG: hypothetical protein B6I19_07475 [Bacteroidetes bacterium 4572_114]|nr:MAG: hypothetical protein B6I19_07475 [Bacteroidetes bacterium 4572_114]
MKKILLIDNEQDNLTAIEAVIKTNLEGCTVLTSLSGEEGIEIAKREQPDTILLDVIMPGMDGYETCKRIKGNELTKHIPIIMITAIKTDTKSRVKGLNMGADVFLSKPIDHVELSAQINVMLRIKEAEDKLRAEKDILEDAVLARAYELKDVDEKYKVTIQNLPLGVLILNHNGLIKSSNPAFTKIFDLPLHSAVGKSVMKALPFVQDVSFVKYFSKLVEKNAAFDFESQPVALPTGRTICLRCRGIPIHDFEKNTNTFLVVIGDVTERKQAEYKLKENYVELKKAMEKAEESDHLKSAFLANISHEIRTPMNGIIAFLDLIAQPELTGEKQKRYINIMKKSSNRMMNTINDLMEISMIEAGQVKVINTEMNVNEQIEGLNTLCKPWAEEKGIKLFYKKTLPENEVVIITDTDKFNSIFTNLVKNAIKFTNEGNVEFGYSLKPADGPDETGMLEFSVKDTGIGIPKERQHAIFDRFVQADLSLSRRYEGTGLGLSISKAYAEMLGGKIWVESEAGVGSQFHFTIPYNPKTKEAVKSKKSVSATSRKPKPGNLKILIVDDEVIADKYLTVVLKKLGKEFLHAKNGLESVEICRNNPDIDLVMMDIRMPEMDGHEATLKIREFNKDVIIIAQTAFALAGDREKVLKAGCNDYISKPIDKDELIQKIEKYFAVND